MTTAATLQKITDAERRRRAQEKRNVAVAQETFQYRDSIVGPVTIERGELVDPGHEAIAAHPEKFDRPGQSRSAASRPELNAPAAAAVARKGALPRPSWSLRPARDADANREPAEARADVQLRDLTGPLKVSFARSADQTIREEAALFRAAGLETGGQLFAHADDLWSWSPKVAILRASGPGTAARHAEDWLDRDAMHEIETAREIDGWSGGLLRESGHWHVHPNGGSVPSPADLVAWVKLLELNRLSRFVGVIVNHDPRRMSPWIVRRNEHSFGARYICERADIA